MPVGTLRKQTKAREFFDWQVFIEQDEKRDTKQDAMMARLSYEVYILRWVVSNMFAKKVDKPAYDSPEDFRIKFKKLKGKKVKKVKKKELPFEERLARSESAWAAFLSPMADDTKVNYES